MGCGICGFVGLSDKSLLNSMCQSIRHRGPDSTGYFLDSGIGLGVDRLKIIDLVTGDQPLHNEDSSIWIVYNGEIYNYVELRGELERASHRFYTATDTEAVIHGYELWGLDCLSHFRGMFAFALWDSKKKLLFIARDRFGKKPLYYAQIGDVLLFGSEIKAILEYTEVNREIDRDALDLFFTYMYIPSPFTIFRSIRKLPPGHYAVYQGGSLKVEKYWDIEFAGHVETDEDAIIDELYAHIEHSVKIRMRSDVPLGAFLSGGIDSSTIVSVMSRLSERPVKTISIGFDVGTSEVKYSRLVAEYLGTDHKEYIVTPSAFEVLPELVRHFDEPFADHSMIPTYYLSKVTRNEVTVALSGDGGDELFMGYPFLVEPASFALYSKVPSSVTRPLLKTLTKVPMDSSFRRMANHAYEKGYGPQSPYERYVMRVSSLDPDGLRRLFSPESMEAHEPMDTYAYMSNVIAQSGSNDPLEVVDYATIRTYLEEGILTKVDRMSMAVSLEVRCPLLDHVLAEYVTKIPASLKMRGRETKHIFKKMAVKKGLIPREIAYRRKQGFGAPIEVWMRGDWRDLTTQLLDPIVSSNYTGLFDRNRVRQFLADPYLHSNRIFSLVTFVQWYEMYVEGTNAVPSGRRLVTLH